MLSKGQILFCSREYNYHKLVKIQVGHQFIVKSWDEKQGKVLLSRDMPGLGLLNPDPACFRGVGDKDTLEL